MKPVLEARRQKPLPELSQVHQQIIQTQEQLARLENRIALLAPPHDKAA